MSWALASFAGLGLLMGIEAWAVWWGPRWYARLSFPLGLEPRPIVHEPEEKGRTALVRWVRDGEEVRFWSPGHVDHVLGLHGWIRLSKTPRGWRVHVRWAPPWSLMAVLMWIVWTAGSQGRLGLSMAASFAAPAVLVLYRAASVRAAAELRWTWSCVDEVVSSGEDGGGA